MINFADVILDLQAGDSGKGKISNHLIRTGEYTHSVRFNGSNNAGHTIYINGKKVVTHSIPAGVLHGVKSIIGPGCAVNVNHFFDELEELRSSGIDPDGLVFVANNAHIITDDHLEEDGKDTQIGTTKRGNGPAYRDKYDRKGIRASEVKDLQPYLIDVYDEFYGPEPCRILFEGAQGFYLDIDWGDYPYVTSSHCTVGSAVMNGVPPQKIRNVYGAAKIYETYVGSKKFEPEDMVFSRLRQLGGEYGATTGRPRQCNWLDVDRLVKAARINGITSIVMSKMDVLRDLNKWCLYQDSKLVEFDSENEMKYFLTQQLKDIVIRWSDNPEAF
jgi:adenylosuccinate synthase